MKKIIVAVSLIFVSAVLAEEFVFLADFPHELRAKYLWIFLNSGDYADGAYKPHIINPSTGNLNGYYFMHAVAFRFNTMQVKSTFDDYVDKAVNAETKTLILRFKEKLESDRIKEALVNVEKKKKDVDKNFPGEWDIMENLLLRASRSGGTWIKFDARIKIHNGNDEFEYKRDADFDKFKNMLKNGYVFKKENNYE